MLKKYLILIFILILVMSTITGVVLKKITSKKFTPYHGPNPSTRLVETTLTPTATLFEPTIALKAAPTLTPTPKVQSKTHVTKYGIAAGGILTGLSQDNLDNYFDGLGELGVTWVRWDIDWNFIQPKNSNNFDWSETDRVASTAKRYGIKSLGTIAYAPQWAGNKPCSYPACAPADPKAFGNFARKVAARYKDSINYFEIWNEPNYPLFWTRPNVNLYAESLKEAYMGIKSVNPGAVILSGGLAASENGPDGSISPHTFLQTLYSLEANQYFDAVALHPYTYPATPSYVAPWNHWQEMLTIRQLMLDAGDEKNIWITEFGAPTNGPGRSFGFNQLSGFEYGSDYMNEDAQVVYIKEASAFYNQNVSWMGPFFWYSLQDTGTSRDTPENFFGLIRFDGGKKLAYDTFRGIINQ